MIIDKLENWEHYHFGSGWKLAIEFLKSLTPDSDEKKYEIQGDEIFAQVMSYETRAPETAMLETHRKYVDIQIVLSGSERFECFSRDELTVEKAYDESKDAEFYKRVCPGPTRVDLFPGTFIMLFPQDAHMPSLMIGKEPERIKKVVVKIKVDLLTLKIC
ncbi:YhcH/YjgK/YiaL family protein [bacterium]|nr:YhcH/YjgK/YiaL family protein [bacterium]